MCGSLGAGVIHGKGSVSKNRNNLTNSGRNG